jgi:hypothetical protein
MKLSITSPKLVPGGFSYWQLIANDEIVSEHPTYQEACEALKAQKIKAKT